MKRPDIARYWYRVEAKKDTGPGGVEELLEYIEYLEERLND